MPAEAVRRVSSKDAPADFLGDVPGVAVEAGDIEVGFIERKRLDQRGVAEKNLPDFRRLGAVKIEADGQKDELRASFPRLKAGHGGVDAELARLVIAGGDDAAPAAAADRDGLPGQFGPLAHFHGGVEAVHVEMDDFAHGERKQDTRFFARPPWVSRGCERSRVIATC